jgi:hypothetical protein
LPGPKTLFKVPQPEQTSVSASRSALQSRPPPLPQQPRTCRKCLPGPNLVW